MKTLQSNLHFFVVLILLFCLVYLGYFFDRSQFFALLASFTILFAGTYYLIAINKKVTLKELFYLGILFRLLLLLSIPFLSQDFYRFIWDGRLVFEGINPYQFTPDHLLSIEDFTLPQASLLREKMGDLSGSHFSNYPPFNQLLFQLAALFSAKSVFGAMLVFKVIIIAADIGIFYFGKQILKYFNWNENKILFYFLNPLVLIELTGNLHFEGVMLFFVIAGFYFLLKEKWISSAVFIGLSISTKLLPLLMLPFFFRYLGYKKGFLYCCIAGLTNVLLFLPFLNAELYSNYTKTIALWFVNFEFNASFYYLVREIGFYVKGYNIIGSVGKFIPLIAILGLSYFAFARKNNSFPKMIQNILLFYTFYFLISTTVHPWYAVNLVVFAIFTRFHFAFVWSFLIVLSYYAYSQNPFQENLYLIFIEYFLLLSFIVYECSPYLKNKFNRR